MEPSVTFNSLVFRRLRADWRALAGVFLGILAAATIAATAPMYVSALERLGLNLVLDQLVRPRSNINAFAFNLHLTHERLAETDGALDTAIDAHIQPIYDGRQRYLLTDTYSAVLPRVPPWFFGNVTPGTFSAYYRSLSDIEHHVTFLDGRMADSEVEGGPGAPRVEAIVSATTADLFELRVGDEVPTAPEPGYPVWVTAEIVGIVVPTDPDEGYWDPHPSLFLDPAPFESEAPGDDFESQQHPPAPLFVTQDAMVDSLGAAYPTSLVNSIWIMLVDKDALKTWGLQEVRTRMDAFEDQFARLIPGSEVAAALNRAVDQFASKVFFSRVPLLLLLTITVVTVLFYVAVISSHLVQSRSGDTAMLRSRGMAPLEMVRLSVYEALAMSAVAVVVAPFAALAVVALAALLPYLRDVTDGALLPASISLASLVAALSAGALAVAVIVLPSVLGSRGGLLAQKLQSGRPPDAPFFQRYYVDVALVVLGGVVFWELRSRGHLISGGLFGEFGINETLMLAPVLFLLAVALAFMRLFPLVVSFLGGESRALVHSAVALAVGSAGAILVVTGIFWDRPGWAATLAIVISIGFMYWATTRARMARYIVGGLLVQAALVYGFVMSEPLDAGDLLFSPSIGLLLLVPAQVAAILLDGLRRISPAWLSMGLRQMARNPFQYTGLVLLIVLASGVVVLSTTVGGTLERNQEDRIRYRVATDIRVENIPARVSATTGAMKDRYERIPGVMNATVALRSDGSAAASSAQVLALESREFPSVTWYRDDFSDLDLGGLMAALRSGNQVERAEVPEFATVIGLWAKSKEPMPGLTVWVVVEDSRGSVTSIPLGTPGSEQWTLLSAELPARLPRPLNLVSVQISEPGVGTSLTPGQILFDNIHGMSPSLRRAEVIEDFEGQRRWFPIVTASLSPERITTTGREAHAGRRAGVFTFAKENHFGVRGFYQSPTGGPVPVVVSTALAREGFISEGEIFVAGLEGRFIPMVVRGIVDYFPTMEPIGGRFILADLDALLGHLNIMGHTPRTRPNELFITGAPGAESTIEAAVEREFRYWGTVHYLDSLLESAGRDPLTTSGWNSMVLLVLATAVVTAGLGYLAYIAAFSRRTRNQIGSLNAVGLSRGQLIGLLGFEHSVIAIVGIGLGAVAGMQMSRLMVASVSFTESGHSAVPPFLLVTDWALMAPAYVALCAVFLAAVVSLIGRASGAEIKTMARLEVE